MFILHEARPGETWADISRRYFGVPDHGATIRAANPSVIGDPEATVLVPQGLGDPDPTGFVSDGNDDDVAVVIAEDFVQHWPSATVETSLDRFSQIRLDGPFEPSDPAVRRAMDPTAFNPVTITVGGRLHFRGQIVAANPSTSSTSRTVSLLAYARAGVLQDCCPSPGSLPLEFTGQTLQQIATSLCEPLGGLVPQFPDGPKKPFSEVATRPDVPLLEFFRKLANQRGLIISNNTNGDPVFFSVPTFSGNPVADLSEGDLPLTSVQSSFASQRYFSHLTGFAPANGPDEGSTLTRKNPLLPNVMRPHNFMVPNTEAGTLVDTVNAKASRMFANLAQIDATVSTWRTPGGALWSPGDYVRLHAPGAMVYDPAVFIIRDVAFSRSALGISAALRLVLPGSFSGELPEVLPWSG